MEPIYRRTAVLDLLLNRENPRHTPKRNQQEIIAYLLSDEQVYNLARHMSPNGINPLEVVAVYPDEDGNLIVAEGNRRICAAQLLTDPDKAPEALRAKFRDLAMAGRDVSTVTIAEFPDYATAQPWLQVLHDGEQDGVGRRRWSPEQKARSTTGRSTDALAVGLLDHAEKEGLLDPADRGLIQISTATRYLANPEVRDALGIASTATSKDIQLRSDDARFRKALEKFLADLRSTKLSSRSKTKEWLEYAQEMRDHCGPIPPSATPQPLHPNSTAPKPATARRAKVRIVTPDASKITATQELIVALNELKSFKLSSLYNSLTSLRLDEHPALLTTGAWVFLETLTALHGRKSGTEFPAYLNSIYGGWGFSKEEWKARRTSFSYIADHGNVEKHDPRFTTVDARNLHAHFQVIDDVLVILATECAGQ